MTMTTSTFLGRTYEQPEPDADEKIGHLARRHIRCAHKHRYIQNNISHILTENSVNFLQIKDLVHIADADQRRKFRHLETIPYNSNENLHT